MPPWFFIWIGRFVRGERCRTTKPGEARLGAATFFIIAVYFGAALVALHSRSGLGAWMESASPMMLWFAFLTTAGIFIFATVAWARRVPTGISTIFAIVAWVVLGAMIVWFEWLPH